MTTYLSTFSGIEGATVAFEPLGWECVGVAEIAPFPAWVLHERCGAGRPIHMPDPDESGISAEVSRERRAAIHAVRKIPEHGKIPNYGDITRMIEDPPDADVLIGGSPCFVAGTTILAKRGMIKIEDVREGDEVWTHMYRWRPVVKTMKRQSETVIVKGQGHWGLETTAEHPFLSREKIIQSTKRQNKPVYIHHHTAPVWTDAKDMLGRFWAAPIALSHMPVPPFEIRAYEGRNLGSRRSHLYVY